MIIKTKRTKVSGDNNNKEIKVQMAESNEPGFKLKKRVVESYRTKIKPGITKAVSESAQDLKEMVIRK